LVAFLFGIISHQVADISWHSLEGLSDGFLEVLSKLGFHNNFGAAHDFGDVADDMIGIFEWNVTSYATEWYVPVQDLVEIYEAYYGGPNDMKEDIIDVCAGMLLVGRVAEQAAGKTLYYEYAKKMPIMLDIFRDYFLGGLDDMSTWTNIVWRQAVSALLGGTEECDMPHNTLAMNCDKEKNMNRIVDMMGKNLYHHPNLPSHSDFLPTYDDLEFIPDGRGVRIKMPLSKIQKAIEVSQNIDDIDAQDETFEKNDVEPIGAISTKYAYSALGKTIELIDLNMDGETDLLVGAPGLLGCVFIVLDYKKKLQPTNLIENMADITLCAEKENTRFGTSLAVLDVNNDGILDIAIGEPYNGAESLSYGGGITVYLGAGGEDPESMFVNTFKILCEETPCGLGNTMFVSKEQDKMELWVSAPNAGLGGKQRGGVVRISGGEWETGKVYFVPRDLEWAASGEQDYEHLGSSITTGPGFVAIGSSTFRISELQDGGYDENDIQVAGKVKIFMADNVTEIQGTTEFGALGSSLAVVNLTIGGELASFLAIGESSADSMGGEHSQTGRVHLYRIDAQLNLVQYMATLSGNSELGRFGMHLQQAWDGGLLIGAPYTGLGLDNWGKVYHVSSDVDLPLGDVTSDCSGASSPCPQQWTSLELTLHEPESLFGSQVRSENLFGQVNMVVAAERSSLRSRMGGSIYVYEF